MITNTYKIHCGMGRSNDWYNAGFSEEIVENLNTIGGSGELNGNRMTLHDYLFSLSSEDKNYSLTYLGGNSFEFRDNYLLTVTTVPKKNIELKCECGGNLKLDDYYPLDTKNMAFDCLIAGEAKCDTCNKQVSVDGEISWRIRK